MNSRTGLLGRLACSGMVALLLGGCAVHYQGLTMTGSPQTAEWKYWEAPASGAFLCLAAPPGTPVYAHPGNNQPIMGYTRDVVAFAGIQEGKWISIVYYDARMGWIDGLLIRPYGDAHPGHKCVADRDWQQRPVFYRN